MKEMSGFQDKDKSIMCPVCRKFLTKASSYDDSVHKLACRHCGHWIWYNPAKNECHVKRVPDRTSSSGKIYY